MFFILISSMHDIILITQSSYKFIFKKNIENFSKIDK